MTDAEELAKNLGIAFTWCRSRRSIEQFTEALEPFFAGTPFGLAEENLQPRIRGTLLMALSNKTGALVLTTGNKSEMACGYCTLYGDMVGALAVIGDVYKTEVYALSRYANREREVIPEDTLTKPPRRSCGRGRRTRTRCRRTRCWTRSCGRTSRSTRRPRRLRRRRVWMLELVRKVIRLVELSEYKRQQAAPVLKVSQKSFGMGRRFPIAARREV